MTQRLNYLKIWLNHFCTSLLPASPVYLQFVPVYFQSTSSLPPVYFQFSSRLQPTSKSTFLCHFFSFYEVWANNDGFGQYIPFWLIRLKPQCLQNRKILIDIIDYSLYTVEKIKNKWSNKLKQRLWTTSNLVEPLLYQSPSSFFQSTSSFFHATSNPLPVYFQFSSNF